MSDKLNKRAIYTFLRDAIESYDIGHDRGFIDFLVVNQKHLGHIAYNGDGSSLYKKFFETAEKVNDIRGNFIFTDNNLVSFIKEIESITRCRYDIFGREPLFHSANTDCLPDDHPLANITVYCHEKECGKMLHCSHNECMAPWFELGSRNYCVDCYMKAYSKDQEYVIDEYNE